MTLLLDNDQVAAVLDIGECIDRLHESYVELAARRAISRTRSDIFGPSDEHGRYVFKTMDGMLMGVSIVATKTPAARANGTGTPRYPRNRNRNAMMKRMTPGSNVIS